MCFNKRIRVKADRKPIKATQDITVYKVISLQGLGWMYNLKINGRTEQWTRGYHYIETTPFASMRIIDKNIIEIEGDGFHSKVKFRDTDDMISFSEQVVEMIIPKGALYYKNDIEYVSSELIFPLKQTPKWTSLLNKIQKLKQ